MNERILQVGIIGTGYVAKKRAEAFQNSEYTQLIAFTGNKTENKQNFANTYNIQMADSYENLINNYNLDLICICNINRDHGLIVHKALEANKHVIVEYPLALNPTEAEELIKLAKQKNKLLHVEHIEILGGLHQAIRENLPLIGNPFFARYTTIAPKKTAPHSWNYNHNQYGFPLIAALSRIHRFTNLFGKVDTVNCQARFWETEDVGYFSSCLCHAQLKFHNGLIGDITYGKGEFFTIADRTFEIYGEKGKLIFEGEKGTLIQEHKITNIEVGSRRGLFAQDTQLVLEHLFNHQPLYIDSHSSLYALKVAYRAFQSSVKNLKGVETPPF